MRCVQDAGDELSSLAGGAPDVGVTRRDRPASLDSVGRSILPQVLIAVHHQSIFEVDAPVDHLFLGFDDLGEVGPLQGFSGDEAKIVGRNLVVLIVEAVWVVEMGVLATELFGSAIHSLGELRHTAVHLLGNGITAVVGAAKHEGVRHAADPDALPGLKVHARLLDGEDVGRGSDDVVGFVILQHQQAGHDLGCACGVARGVFVARP